ncbi:MAG: methyltransferase domain-containing protein [Bacteroidetes bacterium]|nr:methyltransferase domain-containing protein [Bacteroidota bacterium]MCW5897214.1 methyltransferase domain-containing protein [Bacteroidota bacterium]
MTPLLNACPVCGMKSIEMFFEMQTIPVQCNVLHHSRESATGIRKGNLQLGFCRVCGHIYNYTFDHTLIAYTQAYENSLHFSPRFQRFAEELANDLIDRYNLHNKTVIEIGCGKGDFLRMMCEIGGNQGIGFDESFQPDLLEENTGRFAVIRDFYSEKYSCYKPDFVCCRHVLEHISFPAEFLKNIRELIPPECPLYFEVPNMLSTLHDLAIWDLIYEHCSYFTPQSLEYLFTSSGFEVLRVEEKYNRQFLGIEARPATQLARFTQMNDTSMANLFHLISSFSDNYNKRIAEWLRRWADWKHKRIVVWGSGSKGVTFLNVLRPNVEYVVDVNPRKQGMFTAGTGQCIVAPEFLVDYKPDVIIVMNPIYEEEIRGKLLQMGLVATTAVA